MAPFGRLSVLPLELRFQIYSCVFFTDDHYLITLEFERLAEPRDGVLKPLLPGVHRQNKYHAHRRREREGLKELAWPETWPDDFEEAFFKALRWVGECNAARGPHRKRKIRCMIHELTAEMRTPKQISSHINKLKSLMPTPRKIGIGLQPIPPNFLAMMLVNRAIYGELSTHLKSKSCFDFVGDIDALQQFCASLSPTMLCCLRETRLEFMERWDTTSISVSGLSTYINSTLPNLSMVSITLHPQDPTHFKEEWWAPKALKILREVEQLRMSVVLNLLWKLYTRFRAKVCRDTGLDKNNCR